jgi:broad specificity phosphatase PhoE
MQRRRLLMLGFACTLPAGLPAFGAGFASQSASQSASQATQAALWQRLQGGGLVLLVRHAATDPGIGDPPGFALAQCRTQRNLSAGGRREAEALGAAVRAHGVPVGQVLSSRWCRCLDTARLAFGRAAPEPLLDSLFLQDAGQVRTATAALRARLAAPADGANTVLVTHDINIRALVDESVAPGEVLVLRAAPGRLEVLGRLWRPG